eukprot:TRINITY_DN9593_c0_g1_i1.p1 TRINITY_DN9593_c0_g1~~TRINITY_DN9593_c0_g1_i1.p1  ORF type:complete len:131 (+),score=22.75 TRINITY_DN9593_c0_g1_i1:42-434(+)
MPSHTTNDTVSLPVVVSICKKNKASYSAVKPHRRRTTLSKTRHLRVLPPSVASDSYLLAVGSPCFFPPPLPCNTTQFIIDDLEERTSIENICNLSLNSSHNNYGSMMKLIDSDFLKNIRADLASSSHSPQ